jgi:fumarylacetoacetate (FAA) hydrolase
LNAGRARHAFAFDAKQCMAPLPRAYQWVTGSAYPHHVGRMRNAGGDNAAACSAPSMLLQLASDALLGARDDILGGSEGGGIDFEGGIAAVTGDVPTGASADAALESIRLLMLVNGVLLRRLEHSEFAIGAGSLHSRPAAAFSPVAVTPDELGDAWQGGRVHLTLHTQRNGATIGRCDAGAMSVHFGELIADLCKTRDARAGSIVGSGAVSNEDRLQGSSCIAEQRAIETIDHGAAHTDYLKFGDTVRVEMLANDGRSVFGAIEQRVVALPTTAQRR